MPTDDSLTPKEVMAAFERYCDNDMMRQALAKTKDNLPRLLLLSCFTAGAAWSAERRLAHLARNTSQELN